VVMTRPAAADRRRWYQINNSAKGDTPPEILIFDEIDSWFGIAAADFVRDLAKIDAPAVTVRINSPGGDVFDSIAIRNALRDHPASITSIVEGIAGSSASFIALAGDEVVMNRNSQMMLHNAWAVAIGDADAMAKTAAMLGKQNANIAAMYAEKAGGTVEDWLAVMAEETWLTDEEAVAAGLADRVAETGQDAARAAARFDLSVFNHAGREHAPPPRIPSLLNKSPQPKAEVNENKEGHVATLKEGLAQKLGVAADADDETVLTALDEALAERAETPPASSAAPAAEPTVEQATQIAAKFGLAVVDRANYDKLVSDVHILNQQRAAAELASDETAVDAAIREGRIAPASRDSFLTYMRADRAGARNALASIAPNTIPVTEIGHAVGSEDTSVDPPLEHMFNKIVGRTAGKES